jgi:uncharacterized membrane protein YagU involved in acid resistance
VTGLRAAVGRRARAGRGELVVSGLVRGTVAAMAMSALRQVTTGLGLVDQTPPDAILKQRAFGLLVGAPRLAYFVARRQDALVELAHWAYGAQGGVAFALLPDSLVRRRWVGPGYGLATWIVFEFSIAPVLGLEQATRIRAVERAMFAADHVLYGAILAGDRRWALPERGLLPRRQRRRLAGR